MIALGCDHGGYDLMQEVIAYLDKNGLKYKNFGCDNAKDAVDYPDYAKVVAVSLPPRKVNSFFHKIRSFFRAVSVSKKKNRLSLAK